MAANQTSYFLGVNSDGSVRFTVYQAGDSSVGRGVDTAAGAIVAGVFTHVAATFDTNTQVMKIYINGVDSNAALEGGSAAVSSIFAGTAPLGIGEVANSGSGTIPFGGVIDEVDLFSHALTQTEIQNIFNAGSAGKCLPAPVIGVSPGSLSFGNVTVGNTSASQTVTVSNAGAVDLHISTVTANGTNPSDFSIANSPAGATITSGNQVQFQVTFSPMATGFANGEVLAISSDDPASATKNVSLDGTGVAATCTPPPSGMTAWYRAEGDASDQLGVNTGSLNGTPSAGFAAGKVGQAFSLNGY